VVLKCSHSASGYIALCAPPRKCLHSTLKAVPGTWPSMANTMLECSLLQYSISFASTYSCFSFSRLQDFVHALSLTTLSLPVHLSYASWLGPVSAFTNFLAGPSLQTSTEVQDLSHLSCLLFCHFLDFLAVTGHLFPVPAIHSCELSCLSNSVTAVNIYTVLAS